MCINHIMLIIQIKCMFILSKEELVIPVRTCVSFNTLKSASWWTSEVNNKAKIEIYAGDFFFPTTGRNHTHIIVPWNKVIILIRKRSWHTKDYALFSLQIRCQKKSL